jgi:hypothetical protein
MAFHLAYDASITAERLALDYVDVKDSTFVSVPIRLGWCICHDERMQVKVEGGQSGLSEEDWETQQQQQLHDINGSAPAVFVVASERVLA